jgi:predicted permease
MSSVWQDIRVGVRMLTKTPVFTTVAILVLALGIGVNTAVFTLVNAMLLKPLNGGRTGEILGVYNTSTKTPDTYRGVSYPDYVDLRDRSGVFRHLAAIDMTLTGVSDQPGLTRQMFVGTVSSNYFATLGVDVVRGRGFTPEEERPGAVAPVAIASFEYWRRTGFDPAIVGRTVTVAGQPFTIVGVAPEGFTGTMAMFAPEVWLPLSAEDLVGMPDRIAPPARLSERSTHRLMLAGVLAGNASTAAATEQLHAFSRQLAAAYPADDREQTFILHPMSRMGMSTAPNRESELGTATGLLMAMAAVVLFVACLNLANMLLARGTARRREIAIRLAIGGGRWRVIRQLLTEGALLATVGGIAGLVLAFWATRAFMLTLVPVMPIPVTFDAAPDARVLAVTLACAVVSTLVASLGPALSLTRPDLVPDLKDQPRSVISRRGWRALVMPRELMVAGQLALSLMLLTSGGLFLRGALAASVADPGFSLDRGLVVALDPGAANYDEARGRSAYASVLARIRSVPGVEAASLASLVPFGDISEDRDVEVPGRQGGVPSNFMVVTSDYFRSLGLPILRGRGFTEVEDTSADAPRVALVNDVLARRLWPDRDPLGQELRFPTPSGQPVQPGYQVVGVVPSVRHQLFDRLPEPGVYLPFGSQYRTTMTLHVRLQAGGDGPEHAMLGTVRRELQNADRQLPILKARTLAEHRDASISLWLIRAGAGLFSTFGALALVLAGTGLYGVRSYLVSRRTREIGIRMAVGAQSKDVVRLVIGEGLRMTLIGLAVGAVLSMAAATGISSLVYRVSTFDPVTFVVAPAVLLSASLLASWLPARRATRIAPVSALRTE